MKPNAVSQARRKKVEALLADNRIEEAAAYCEQVLRQGERSPTTQLLLAIAYRRLGRHAEAEREAQAVLQLRPDCAEAHQALGAALQCQGRMSEAVKCYQAAIRLNPRLGEAHYLLGNLLREQGLLEKAADAYRASLRIDPDHVPTLCNLGGTLAGLLRFEEAAAHLNKANRLRPGAAPVLCNIARVLQLTGRPGEAENICRDALRYDPQAVEAMVMLGDLLEKSSQLAESREIVERGLAVAPGHAGLLLVAARLARRDKRYTEGIAIAEQALKGVSAADKQSELHHLLGLLYDREGEAARAFAHFTEGNRITAITVAEKDHHRYLSRIDRHRQAFRATLPASASLTRSRNDDTRPDPFFLVGFPRSGTTLLEQILDSHPALRALDERPTVGAMMKALENISARRSDAGIALTETERTAARDSYFREADRFVRCEPGQLLVDKFPLNLINAWHIWRVFPEAKFILAIRHPCDVCLSCFMQNFTLNEAMTAFTNLDDTVRHYAAVMNLWQEFTEKLPIRYHMLRYEDLIEDVEKEARRLLEFLGLEWDDAILGHVEHAQRRGTISTPSYHQVTQPIYKTARYRWTRYAAQLEDVMPTLHPFIERFGYLEIQR